MMRPWGKATESEYLESELRAHEFLADVPLHDVWRVALTDAPHRPCSLMEVRRVALGLFDGDGLGSLLPALFRLRRKLGALLGWDREPTRGLSTESLTRRVPPAVLSESLVEPGSSDGPFHVVYVTHDEAVSEIRNGTVAAYLVWALRPGAGGCELLFAIHVEPVGRWTRPYLALIAPFRRFIVYPRLLGSLHAAWRH